MSTLTADDATSFAQPERLREASQRMVNFWIGAMSPAWAPFFAASSFGLSAWALTQSLSKSEGLFSDLPLAAKWPGFAPWLNAALPEEEPVQAAAEVVEQAAGFVAPVAEDAVETAKTGLAAVVEPVTTLAEDLAPQLEHATQQVADDTKPLIDPVTEAPVVPAAVEAVAEPSLAPAPEAAARPSPSKAKKPGK